MLDLGEWATHHRSEVVKARKNFARRTKERTAA